MNGKGGSIRARVRSKGGVREEGSKGAGNFKGGTLRRTILRIFVLQMKNSELVYKLCIVMRRNVLVDRCQVDGIILCDGNYRLGAYGMDLVRSRPIGNPSEAG